MKTNIYYFTGTGNSLKIARDLSRELDVPEPISMALLAKQSGNISIDGEIVGFIFPVYFARPPVFIKEFMDRSVFSGKPYIFAIMDGGGLFGRALPLFDAMLRKRRQKLDAGFSIPMPGNHPKIARFNREDQDDQYKAEEEKIRHISRIIQTLQPHRIETNWSLLGRCLSSYGFRKAYKLSQAKKLDSDLWVDNSCTQCGTCEKICPTSNISLADGKPRWHGKCINCAACYHHCPSRAICLGEEDPDFRYTHPDVSLEDMFKANR